jgi:hypothetical protein
VLCCILRCPRPLLLLLLLLRQQPLTVLLLLLLGSCLQQLADLLLCCSCLTQQVKPAYAGIGSVQLAHTTEASQAGAWLYSSTLNVQLEKTADVRQKKCNGCAVLLLPVVLWALAGPGMLARWQPHCDKPKAQVDSQQHADT